MKEVLTHHEMCSTEDYNLQKGMNYKPGNKKYSILLMSSTDKAPYNDGFSDSGEKLFYEGEDLNRREHTDVKSVDQPLFTKTGKLTNNGKFFKAAESYKTGRQVNPDKVKVYEKITNNVWSDKGLFYLTDVTYQYSDEEQRKTFKFILIPIESHGTSEEMKDFEFSRRIPTNVKRIVWERDQGRCITCGATDNLHFDHIIPYSKGGSSLDPMNVQILCGKHNLKKSDRII